MYYETVFFCLSVCHFPVFLFMNDNCIRNQCYFLGENSYV